MDHVVNGLVALWLLAAVGLVLGLAWEWLQDGASHD
jgi:hypothetical protein